MSATNFMKKNASRYYVINNNEYDDEEDYDFFIEMEIEDKIMDLLNRLEKIGYEKVESGYDNNRYYSGKIIAEKVMWYKPNMLGARIEAIVRNGYYTGINFDWNLYWIDEDGNRRDFNDKNIVEFAQNYLWNFSDFDENKNDYVINEKEIKRVFGMGYKSLLKDIEKWKEKVLEKEIDELERHFSLVCDDELELIGVFSNGEGAYRSKRNIIKEVKN
jgi:hypothetical protein